jgi:hypothetical protein
MPEIQVEVRQKTYLRGFVKFTWLNYKPFGVKIQLGRRIFKMVWEYRKETS